MSTSEAEYVALSLEATWLRRLMAEEPTNLFEEQLLWQGVPFSYQTY